MAVSATSTTGENTYSRMRRLPVLISAVSVVTGDATREADIAGTIRQAMARFGRLDAVFNNAGLQERRAPLAEQTDAVYTQVFDTNVRALFHAMRHEISALLGSGGGAIVNNTSVSGMRNPNPGLSTLRRLEGRSHLAYASGGNGICSLWHPHQCRSTGSRRHGHDAWRRYCRHAFCRRWPAVAADGPSARGGCSRCLAVVGRGRLCYRPCSCNRWWFSVGLRWEDRSDLDPI